MAIPVISDIIGTIQKVIDWVQRTIPRPVQFLFFLVFLLFIGNTLMPIFFNMMGTFCIDDEKYTNEFYDVTTNIATTFKIFNTDENSNETIGGVINVEDECLTRITEGNVTTLWYQGTFCTNCTAIGWLDPLYLKPAGTLTDNYDHCKDDAYRVDDKSFLQRWFCESRGEETLIGFSCEPPAGFHHAYGTDTYICHDSSVCGNFSENSFLKNSLVQNGFTKVQQTQDAEPSLVGISCFGNNPKLTVIGIDLFKWEIWLFLTLIGVLFWAWLKFK